MYILWIDYTSEGQSFQGLYQTRDAAVAAMEVMVAEEPYMDLNLYMTTVTADGGPLGRRLYYRDI